MVGQSTVVGGRGLDAVGNITGDAVTFTSCDGAVVTVGDGGAPEGQFTSFASLTGAGLGDACVLAQAAGFTDTVRVSVGPAGMSIVGPDTVLSGTTVSFNVAPVDAAGTELTGTAAYVWATSNKAQLVADPALGTTAGRSPGSVDLRVAAPGGANAKKAVVVVPDVFPGTLSATSAAPGELITATRPAGGLAFDADVAVRLASTNAFVDLITQDAVTFAVPATGSTAAAVLTISNITTDQIAHSTTFTATKAAEDVYSPGNITNDCSDPAAAPDYATVKSPSGWVYLVHNGTGQGTRGCQNSGAVTGYDHYIVYTTGASAEVIDVEARWTLSGDNDIIVCKTDYSDCPGAGFSSGTLEELEAVDVELEANSSYWIIYSPWTGATGNNLIRIKITKE